MSTDDPTQARVFTAEEATRYASAAPAVIKLPHDLAAQISANLETLATYHAHVAVGCATAAGKEAATQIAKAYRSYAAGLRAAAT